MGRIVRHMEGTGDLSGRLISDLLFYNCPSDESGTVHNFTVHLHCESFDVEVHAVKESSEYEDGKLVRCNYRVASYTLRECEEDEVDNASLEVLGWLNTL